jgi:hypothetical protein
MNPQLYQIKLGNTTAYSKSYNKALKFQNEIYKRSKEKASIKPIEKSKIPIGDWEIVNELSNPKVDISMRYE